MSIAASSPSVAPGAIADNLPVMVSNPDATQRHRYFYRLHQALYGRHRYEIVDLRVCEPMAEEAYETVSPHFARALAGRAGTFAKAHCYGVVRGLVVHSLCPDGRPRIYANGFTDLTHVCSPPWDRVETDTRR